MVENIFKINMTFVQWGLDVVQSHNNEHYVLAITFLLEDTLYSLTNTVTE